MAIMAAAMASCFICFPPYEGCGAPSRVVPD
jgi:hypothetical protein